MKERKGSYKDISKEKIKEKHHRIPSLRLVCVEDPMMQSSNMVEVQGHGVSVLWLVPWGRCRAIICQTSVFSFHAHPCLKQSNVWFLAPTRKKETECFRGDNILVFSQILDK